MFWKEKDTIESYVKRVKGYQNKLRQLKGAFDNKKLVEAIYTGLPARFNTTKVLVIALMTMDPNTKLDVIVHLLTREKARQKK